MCNDPTNLNKLQKYLVKIKNLPEHIIIQFKN